MDVEKESLVKGKVDKCKVVQMSSATAPRDTIGSGSTEGGGCLDDATRFASAGESGELAVAVERHWVFME